MSMYRNFHAVRPVGAQLTSWTTGEFADWALKYLTALQPEWPPEYLVDKRDHFGRRSPPRMMPTPDDMGPEGFKNPVCYVHEGSCEGYLLQVGYKDRNEQYHELAFAKYLGDPESAWEGARALSEALGSIYGFGEMPMLVDLQKALVGAGWQYPQLKIEADRNGRRVARVEKSGDQVTVRCQQSGRLLADVPLLDETYQDLEAEAIIKDFTRILEGRGIEIGRTAAQAA